jgi:hypothetical protein
MDLILTVVVAGVIGTLAMDSLNLLFARAGLILKIDVRMVGRLAVGWAHGRFCYNNPDEIHQVENEKLSGYLTHYSIGVLLAFPYVIGWYFYTGGSASPSWAPVYGIVTSVASYFLVFPSMGLGLFGMRSSERLKGTFSSLLNHLFYGLGLAIGLMVV